MGSSTNTGGASGSFFFFTEDKKYIVKTMPKSELDLLNSMANDILKFGKESSKSGFPSSLC